jgi:hypothetical protein
MSSPLHDTVCILNNEGTPVLKENENEILYRILQSVSLYIIEDKVEKDGVMYVTSHRLIWADALRTRARQWYLWQIEGDPRMEARNLFSVFSSTTSRILIIFKEPRKDDDMTQSKDYPTLSPPSTSILPSTVSSSSSSSLSSLIRLVEVKISYGDKNINVLEDIRNALQRRAWLEERSNHLSLQSITNSIQTTTTTTTTTTTRLGLAGIQEAESREKAAARAIAAEALRGDLASLEMHAKKMVVLAENYAIEVEKARIRKAAAAAAATTTTTTTTTTVGLKQEISTLAEDEDSSWAQQMQNVGTFAAGMGIVSPVTKSMAGSAYISELARQLSIVLKPHLQRRGGIVSLTDAFCLLNRARGTEVVSPEDLVQAVGLLSKLQLGMRERNIEVSNKGERGGASFRAIQLDSFSDAAITSRILDMIDNSEKKNDGDMMSMTKKSFVTTHGVSKALGIPVPLVTQILLQAEGNAILCRDESLAGLRFYNNVFKT